MRFADTKLPQHPVIEQAFNELTRLDTDNQFTDRGLRIAQIIAAESLSKDPDAIAAGLLVPMASDTGQVLLAQATLPPRVTEIIQSVFDIGGMTMRGEPIETFYKELDSGARSVILASSYRMFEVMAAEMEESLIASRRAGAKADAAFLQETLDPVKKFTGMICRAEAEEKQLAQKCDDAVIRIETLIHGANPPAPTKAAPAQPKP
ncbi:MAG: hypothetical protein PSY14_06235 [bacterium]|nr:hypothetical protein [bacterium]